LVVLATRSITSHLIGQCIQRVVENYYALQSTRIRPQRPPIHMRGQPSRDDDGPSITWTNNWCERRLHVAFPALARRRH